MQAQENKLKQLFQFPDPVNENAARVVAGGVVVLSLVTIVFNLPWLLIIIAYGFIARVLTGPTLSPLGQVATRLVAPHLPVKYCPGPPKRFAQGIGAVMSLAALVLALGLSLTGPAYIVLAVLTFFAFLESAFGFCLGCRVFSLLMRLGLIPEEICERCNNLNFDAA